MEPVDLAAIVGEPDREPFAFIWDGLTYTLPADVDVRGAAALQSGRFEEGLQIWLGAEQWQQLLHAPSAFGTRHLDALLKEYETYIGASLGESLASTTSSPATPKRSRPTSNGSTGSPSRRSARAS